MTHYWEMAFFAGTAVVALVLIILSVVQAWLDDRRKWKAVQPFYGSQYDATVRPEPRPNIRLVRP